VTAVYQRRGAASRFNASEGAPGKSRQIEEEAKEKRRGSGH